MYLPEYKLKIKYDIIHVYNVGQFDWIIVLLIFFNHPSRKVLKNLINAVKIGSVLNVIIFVINVYQYFRWVRSPHCRRCRPSCFSGFNSCSLASPRWRLKMRRYTHTCTHVHTHTRNPFLSNVHRGSCGTPPRIKNEMTRVHTFISSFLSLSLSLIRYYICIPEQFFTAIDSHTLFPSLASLLECVIVDRWLLAGQLFPAALSMWRAGQSCWWMLYYCSDSTERCTNVLVWYSPSLFHMKGNFCLHKCTALHYITAVPCSRKWTISIFKRCFLYHDQTFKLNWHFVDFHFAVALKGEKDVRSHPQHHPRHGEHGGLRRVRELPAQPFHRVCQIQRIRHLPQQTQPGQETRQPAGDRALLFHSKYSNAYNNNQTLIHIHSSMRHRRI